MSAYAIVVTIVAALAAVIALLKNAELSRLRKGAETDHRPVNPREMWARVGRLNLDRVKEALRKKGVSQADITRDEELYRKFLFLNGITTERIVPWSQGLDEFWHAHVLDLQKYVKDCNMLFGGILFHRPFITRDAAKQHQLARRTLELYQSAFVPPPSASPRSLARHRKQQESGGDMPWMFFLDGSGPSVNASPPSGMNLAPAGGVDAPSASSCSSGDGGGGGCSS